MQCVTIGPHFTVQNSGKYHHFVFGKQQLPQLLYYIFSLVQNIVNVYVVTYVNVIYSSYNCEDVNAQLVSSQGK